MMLKPQIYLSWQHPERHPAMSNALGLHAAHFRPSAATTAAFSEGRNPKALQYPAGHKGTLLPLLFQSLPRSQIPEYEEQR